MWAAVATAFAPFESSVCCGHSVDIAARLVLTGANTVLAGALAVVPAAFPFLSPKGVQEGFIWGDAQHTPRWVTVFLPKTGVSALLGDG